MSQERLCGSPFDGLPQDDLFEPVESRGEDLMAKYACEEPRVTYLNFGCPPRNPFDDCDTDNGPHSIFGGSRPRGPLPTSRARRREAVREIVSILAKYIRTPEELIDAIDEAERRRH